LRVHYPNSAPNPSSAASSFCFSSSAFFFLSSGGAALVSGVGAAAAAGWAAIMVGAALIASSMLTSLNDAMSAFTRTGSAVMPAAERTPVRVCSFISLPAL